MRYYFNEWVKTNELDPVTNEFYDKDDEWTYNYGNADMPGGWKGWYTTTTIRPIIHLGNVRSFEKAWWDSEYTYYAENDFNVYP